LGDWDSPGEHPGEFPVTARPVEFVVPYSPGIIIIWLVVWNMFFHILGIILPTDFHIFQRG
jgi:hypothetical protein